jgi:hypothetical protein
LGCRRRPVRQHTVARKAARRFGSCLARLARRRLQTRIHRLNVAEQQVQRYEATQYQGVSVERLQAVADALKLRVREVITLEPL